MKPLLDVEAYDWFLALEKPIPECLRLVPAGGRIAKKAAPARLLYRRGGRLFSGWGGEGGFGEVAGLAGLGPLALADVEVPVDQVRAEELAYDAAECEIRRKRIACLRASIPRASMMPMPAMTPRRSR